MNKKLYPHCSVLVGFRNGLECDLQKQKNACFVEEEETEEIVVLEEEDDDDDDDREKDDDDDHETIDEAFPNGTYCYYNRR